MEYFDVYQSDNNRFVEYGGAPNGLNGYKLGDSLKSIVNDSDKE